MAQSKIVSRVISFGFIAAFAAAMIYLALYAQPSLYD